MPGFNNERRVQPYLALKPLVGVYIKDEIALAKLAQLQSDMRTKITNLINNPRNAEMWKRVGYAPK